MKIETDRLIIRPPKMSDVPVINAGVVESFNELHSFMEWAHRIPTIQDTTESIARAINQEEPKKEIRLLIFTKENEYIGSSGIHSIDWRIPKGETGYWIRTSKTGQGFAAESTRAIIDYAINELKFRRIELLISGTNSRSQSVMERLGIPIEAVLRNHRINPDGTIDDTCIYSVTDKNPAPVGFRKTET